MSTANLTSSRATTTTAGLFVLASAVMGLGGNFNSAALYEIPRTAGPVALLVGTLVLVFGVRGEKGLFRYSTAASTGLLAFAATTVLSRLLLSTTTATVESDQRVLGLVLLALTLLGLTGSVIAITAVLRRNLLEVWSGRTLLAVLVTRAALAMLGFVPSFADDQVILVISQASVIIPLALLALGVALVLHGRGPVVRAGTRRLFDGWRSSTDVVSSSTPRRP